MFRPLRPVCAQRIGKWKELIALILGALIPFVLIQGTIDYFIWGKPFVEVIEYFKGNIHAANDYITGPWYQYFLVILGLLIPPVSVMIFYGFLRTWRKFFIIFLPVALFFIAHSSFPNKQERFLFPILPFIIITGIIGWNEFQERSAFWKRHNGLTKTFWIIFWVLNLSVLPVVSMVYSKKSRVESMVYLSRYKNIKEILVVDSHDNPELFPRFYLGQWPHMYDELKDGWNGDSLIIYASKHHMTDQPRFILFTGDELKPERVISVRKSFPFIVYETTIYPGFIDQIMHWLNPVNVARKDFIYRNCDARPCL